MKKIYFDSNIYAEVIRRNISAQQIKDILSKKKLKLIMSSENVFEMASCWKSGKPADIEDGIKRFSLTKELLPCLFLQEIPSILLMELDKIINGASISPYFINQDKDDMEKEIIKFANGVYDAKAKEFVESRWAGKREYVSTQASTVIANRDLLKTAETYREFLCNNEKAQKGLAENVLGERVKHLPDRYRRRFADKILKKPRQCPMVTTWIKSNLFLDFRVIKFGKCSHDTLDDLRHLINASYADIFVTNDKNLLSYSNEINPSLEVKEFGDI